MRPIFRLPLMVLVSFVLLNAQAMALGPGVPYGGGNAGFAGSYTGILIPGSAGGKLNPNQPISPAQLIGANALGLFSLVSQSSGLVTGNAIFFINDIAYRGAITGIGDNRKQQIIALFNIQSVGSFVDGSVPGAPVTVRGGSGRMVASLDSGGNRGSRNLTGSATVSVSLRDSSTGTFDFVVDGVRQLGTTTGTAADLVSNFTTITNS